MTNYYLEPFLKKGKIKVKTTNKKKKIQGGEPGEPGETTSRLTQASEGLSNVGSTLANGASSVGKMAAKGAVYGTSAVVGTAAAAAGIVPYVGYRGVKTAFDYLTKTSDEHILATKIIGAFQKALGIMEVEVKELKRDYEKIKNLKMTNQIDLNYGGGFLIFDSNFKIQHMLHVLNDPQNKPKFMSLPIGENMENNTINANLKENHQPLNIIAVLAEIKKIVDKDPLSSNPEGGPEGGPE